MEIINTYDETLAYYDRKLRHAEEELDDALRSIKGLGTPLASGWAGPAASAFAEGMEALSQKMREPKQEIGQVRQALFKLRTAIEEEIRALAQEEAKAAEAAAMQAAGEAFLNG